MTTRPTASTASCLLPGSSHASFWVTRKLMVWVCITKSTQTTFSFEPKMDLSSVKTKLREKQNSATISESWSTCTGEWLIIQVVFTSRLLCLCLLGVIANWLRTSLNRYVSFLSYQLLNWKSYLPKYFPSELLGLILCWCALLQ